ncbi:4-fold beta flower protein [Clostridium sp. BJN0013]|uniref:5-fold beta-flower protein n=1 Tax=Clostridium sp. BJN0013 TaxID=3236840 RepID=UPI0034C610F4
MERIYDRNDRIVGYLKHNNTVYDRYNRIAGYIDTPVLYDANCRRIGYVRNGTLYKRNGSPSCYFNGWHVHDMRGHRLGHVNSSWLGLLAAGLLLGLYY